MLFFNLLSDLNFTISLVVVVSITALFGIWINKKYEFGLVSIFFIVICFLLILNIAVDYVNYFKKVDNIMTTQEDWGAMGDYIGGILNPILTFITIIILLWTNHNQNKELKKQLERQDKESKKNDFDRMFTLMLEQHNTLLVNLDENSDISCIYENLTSSSNYDESELEKKFGQENYTTMNTYLRFLYRFLKYLSENEKTVDDINEYSDIVRSFLSEKLLYIIAINGIRNPSSISKFKEYRELIEKFYFIEHINLTKLKSIKPNNHLIGLELYSKYKTSNTLTQEFKTFMLNLKLHEKPQMKIFTQYNRDAFDQNPYYLKNVLPTLEFLVENNALSEELLKTKPKKQVTSKSHT